MLDANLTNSQSNQRDNALTRWIDRHDETWLFTGIYISLAVTLSMAISMFWLAAVAFAHGCLEWYALSRKGESQKLKKVLWHLRLDIVLILFALWLGVYMSLIFGMVGLGAFARASAAMCIPASPAQTLIRGSLLVVDDVAQVTRGVLQKRARKQQSAIPADPEHFAPPADAPSEQFRTLGWPDRILVGVGVVLVLTIILAPWVTGESFTTVAMTIAGDLHPWPEKTDY